MVDLVLEGLQGDLPALDRPASLQLSDNLRCLPTRDLAPSAERDRPRS